MKTFVTIAILYLVVDLLWIYVMSPMLYMKALSKIQKSTIKFNKMYAILAYILLLVTIFKICIPLSKTYTKRKWLAFTIVGVSIYGIYNLTNAAVFSDYSAKMIIIDTLWGGVVFSMIGLLHNKIIKSGF